MRTLMGAVVVALGVVLVICGLDATECLSHRISRILHDFPTEKSIYFLAGGVVTMIVGLSLAYRRDGERI